MKQEGEIISKSAETTLRWGKKFAHQLLPGDAVFLIGDLGVGKTTLARGIAQGLNYQGLVTSPSFTLLKTYLGRMLMRHCDLYRLKPGDNINDLGLEEMLEGDGIAVFEWSENFPIAQTTPRWEVRIAYCKFPKERSIKWKRIN
jgi:tRNA threonylcarbamoyladenosine biosynthesis protein TsaE